MTKNYIAIVQQPAVASVVLVEWLPRGEARTLLFQHVRSWCEGYARAAAEYEAGDDGQKLDIRNYHCAAGNTLKQNWILTE